MRHANLEQLITVAQLLRPLLDELVFVGGAVTGLLITDEAAGEPRATLDVDAILEIVSYAEYTVFGERLHALGFSEDMSESPPVCRWVQGDSILDLMPLDEKVLDSQTLGTRQPCNRPCLTRSHVVSLFVRRARHSF